MLINQDISLLLQLGDGSGRAAWAPMLDNFLVHDRHDLQELQRLARSINWPAVTIAVRLAKFLIFVQY